MKRSKRPPAKVLVQLDLGVEDILNEFGWLGFSGPDIVGPPDRQEQLPGVEGMSEAITPGEDSESPDQYEEVEDSEEAAEFEREDIEIGVDRLISRMIKTNLINKEKTGRQPTLWRVFTTFYDESHPIIELVDSFEQHIKGYFGMVEYDEMQAAFDDILKVQELIKQDLETASA